MKKFILAICGFFSLVGSSHSQDIPAPFLDEVPPPAPVIVHVPKKMISKVLPPVINPRKVGMDRAINAIVGIGGELSSSGSRSFGTATIIGPVRKDGKSDVLTADHCTGPLGSKVDIVLPDGKTIKSTVAYKDPIIDFAWVVTDHPTGVMGATIARGQPKERSTVWHRGLGHDRPGSHEIGNVVSVSTTSGFSRYDKASQDNLGDFTSSGDSGCGVFNDNGEVVFVHSGAINKNQPFGALAYLALSKRPQGDVVPAPASPLHPLLIYRAPVIYQAPIYFPSTYSVAPGSSIMSIPSKCGPSGCR